MKEIYRTSAKFLLQNAYTGRRKEGGDKIFFDPTNQKFSKFGKFCWQNKKNVHIFPKFKDILLHSPLLKIPGHWTLTSQQLKVLVAKNLEIFNEMIKNQVQAPHAQSDPQK